MTFYRYRRAVVAAVFAFSFWPQAALSNTSYEQQTWETQIGQQRYMAFEQRGEIVSQQSPLYQTLDPIGSAIASVANPQYFAPFHFVLLNDPAPNAMAMPGGNVYVTTGLLSFLKNRDELAGVICHEVNHDIHHDMYAVYQATQGGRAPQDPNAIAYERQVENNADRAGAYTCARAGFNPWGMVWNFRLHGQTPSAAAQGSPNSDHPSDDQRASQLIALFQSDPATFGRFRDDVAAAKPLAVPQMQVSQQYGYGSYSQPSRPYAQYPSYPQQYQQYPQQYQQYPQQPQGYPQYPQQPQGYPQYPQPQQYPQQQGPYPPPPLPPCYPNC